MENKIFKILSDMSEDLNYLLGHFKITDPSSQAKGWLFLRLGIILAMQITKTIKGST